MLKHPCSFVIDLCSFVDYSFMLFIILLKKGYLYSSNYF